DRRLGGRRRRVDDEAYAVCSALDGRDASALAHDAREHGLRLLPWSRRRRRRMSRRGERARLCRVLRVSSSEGEYLERLADRDLEAAAAARAGALELGAELLHRLRVLGSEAIATNLVQRSGEVVVPDVPREPA